MARRITGRLGLFNRMAKKILAALIALFISDISDAAVAWVQEAHNDTAGAASSFVVTISPTAGNTLVVGVAIDTILATPNVSSITGATCTQQGTQQSVVGGGSTEIWTCLNIGSGITSLTINLSLAVRAGGSVNEYSGVTSIGTNTSTSGTGTSASITLGSENFIVSVYSTFGGNGSAITGNLRLNQFALNQGNVATYSMDNAGTTTTLGLASSVPWASSAVGLSAGATASPAFNKRAALNKRDEI